MHPRASHRLMRGKWSPLASAIVALILICTVGTVLVGRELYKVTGQQTQFNTK